MSIRDTLTTLANVPTLLALKRGLKVRPDSTCDSLAARLQSNAERFGTRTAIIFEGRSVTWAQLNAMANRYAHALAAEGVGDGDTVSLFMENRIEYLACILAVNKLGAVGALINTNLTGKPLTHCVTVTKSSKCIVGAELADALAEVQTELSLAEGEDFLFVADGNQASAPNWAKNLDTLAGAAQDTDLPQTSTFTIARNALYIFTSGTTGLPKAAVLSNRRYLSSGSLAHVAGLRCDETDRLYVCLPLYHGTGLMIGVGAALSSGASLFIRRRFSASNFLKEVREHQCTCLIYIGELCRYLCNSPAGANDNDNPLRAAMGNGLRPDIWMQFKTRYGIERISEFYGSSEGNVSFANLMNKNETIGMTANEIALVKYDVDAEEIQRDENGKVVEVAPGEPGLLLGKITETHQFEGYTDSAATDSKIVRDLREPGDAWFNTGDLIREIDVGFSLGYPHYQFVDRLGDTFRWKSENVSTNEVGEIINQHPQIRFSNVYGVEVPNADGRAGMAALALAEGISALDIESFSAHVRAELPAYAVPVFIRIQQELDVTGTFKMVKGELRKVAYDIRQIADPVYVMRPGSQQYELLDETMLHQIEAGDFGF